MSDFAPHTSEEIRDQVRRISQSDGFRDSERLQDFLDYIVEEALAGRATQIKGLTVAQAVFAAGANFDPESNSIVRVEAGRLRRRLEHYYAGPGRHDRVIITVPKGSYAPAFAANPDVAETADPGNVDRVRPRGVSPLRPWSVAVLVVVVASLAWLLSFLLEQGDNTKGETMAEPALKAESEAQILFQQAFVILMPPENRARLDTAVGLFQSLVEQHPDFPGGYAGQSLAMSIGVLFIKSRDRQTELEEAKVLAEQAIAIDADYSLGFAALAFAQSLSGQHESAMVNARRAIAVRDRQSITPAMVSLTLFNSDRPQEAIEVLELAREQNLDEPRTPYLNLLGIGRYLVGDYDGALANFELNLARNGPTGPHMDAFVAATYAHLGREFQARAILEHLAESQPDYPVRLWMANYIKDPDKLQSTMAMLHELGWPAD